MFNLFRKLLCAAALASAVLAQNITIASPAAGTTVHASSSIVVEIERPMTLTASEEVAIVIAAFSCAAGCPDVTQTLGNILYSGPYQPQLTSGAQNPSQNFTVTVPSWYMGPVQLAVARFFLLGAYGSPQMQFATTSLEVVGGSG